MCIISQLMKLILVTGLVAMAMSRLSSSIRQPAHCMPIWHLIPQGIELEAGIIKARKIASHQCYLPTIKWYYGHPRFWESDFIFSCYRAYPDTGAAYVYYCIANRFECVLGNVWYWWTMKPLSYVQYKEYSINMKILPHQCRNPHWGHEAI